MRADTTAVAVAVIVSTTAWAAVVAVAGVVVGYSLRILHVQYRVWRAVREARWSPRGVTGRHRLRRSSGR
jgi:hypothetical protein